MHNTIRPSGALTFLAVACLILSACNQAPSKTFVEQHPDTLLPAPASAANNDQHAHGRYLVTLLGCGSCHTDGALIGLANSQYLLAGSRTGIATSNPLVEANPGIVFPPNLTPDLETGLGHWSETDIVMMLKGGEDRHGIKQSGVMPWAAYAQLTDQDARAIARYLKSLAPVHNAVPKRVRPGQVSTAAHVYFGVYVKK